MNNKKTAPIFSLVHRDLGSIQVVRCTSTRRTFVRTLVRTESCYRPLILMGDGCVSRLLPMRLTTTLYGARSPLRSATQLVYPVKL